MKKLAVILVLLVYGPSSFGMTLHFHYCCGRLERVDLTPPKAKHCGGNDQKISAKSCCDTKEVRLNIKSDQDAGKVLQLSFQCFTIKASPDFLISGPVETTKPVPEIFAPPPLKKELTHLYCIYRI